MQPSSGSTAHELHTHTPTTRHHVDLLDLDGTHAGNPLMHEALLAADQAASLHVAAGARYDPASTALAAVQFALLVGAPPAAPGANPLPPAPPADADVDLCAYIRGCAARLARMEAETAFTTQLLRDVEAQCSVLQRQSAEFARFITAHRLTDGGRLRAAHGVRAAHDDVAPVAAAHAAPVLQHPAGSRRNSRDVVRLD
jgi:hypothetical protein